MSYLFTRLPSCRSIATAPLKTYNYSKLIKYTYNIIKVQQKNLSNQNWWRLIANRQKYSFRENLRVRPVCPSKTDKRYGSVLIHRLCAFDFILNLFFNLLLFLLQRLAPVRRVEARRRILNVFSETLQVRQEVELTVSCVRPQVTRGMFGANRKKFMEGGVESDYADDSSLYYTQQSMFPPHRPDKDVSFHLHRWTLKSTTTLPELLAVLRIFCFLRGEQTASWGELSCVGASSLLRCWRLPLLPQRVNCRSWEPVYMARRVSYIHTHNPSHTPTTTHTTLHTHTHGQVGVRL